MSNPMAAGEFLDFLDGDAWVAAVERRKSGAAIAAANPVDLEEIR